MPPPKKRTLTPRNKSETDQRQQTSNRVEAHLLGRYVEILIHRKHYPEKGKGTTTRLACNTHEFDENKVDARVKTHWCGDFNVVCEHCNALQWREERTW